MEAVRNDGYYNAFTGAGIMGRDPFAATRFGRQLRDWGQITQEADNLFTDDGVAQRIVTAPAEEALRAGWSVSAHDMKQEQAEKLDSLQEDLRVKEAMSLALSWDRLFGGAAVLLMANDGGTLEDPLNIETLKNIERLEVFSPQDISYSGSYLYSDPMEPTYGKPQFYSITSKWGNVFLVHESRLLLFYGLPITNSRRRARQGWGGTVMEQVRNALMRFGSGFDAARVAIERLSQSVLKFSGLASKLMNAEGEKEIMRRLHVIDMGRHLLNTIAIDTNEDYAQHNVSISSLRDVLEEFEIAISAATGIPTSILFGRSPAGMNSTGKSDLESYYNMVGRIQERTLRPNLAQLIYLLSKCKDSEITLPEHWEVKFAPLWNPTEKELAETNKLKAEARNTNANAMKTLSDIGALDVQEMRMTLAAQSDYVLDRSVDDLLSQAAEK